mmetsp:Transcript_96180/g.170741  ORF Transcript_96180/g.170741 Transcript_96180/m.170741 type:complete len:748 (-) Transcript_96180:92-2335(-)
MSETTLTFGLGSQSSASHGSTSSVIQQDNIEHEQWQHAQDNIDAKDSTGQTSLMRACSKDAVEDARSLLEKKANVNIFHRFSGEPATALSMAVLQGSRDLVKLLLENWAEPNLVLGPRGHQPLSHAARLGDVEKMRLLLDAKALVDELPRARDPHSQHQRASALVEASKAGNPEAVSFLVKSRASIEFRDLSDMNALMHVVSWCPSRKACANYDKVAEILLEAGISACDRLAKNVSIPRGRSVLMMACRSANLSTVRLLLAKRASAEINTTDSSGASALMISIWRACPEFVQLLLQSRADVNIVNQKGVSAASYADRMHSSQVIRNLVGACVTDSPSQQEDLLDQVDKRRRTAASADSVIRSDEAVAHSSKTDQRHGEVDLSELQQAGGSNWVFHNGRVINLEDEADTACLAESEFATLLAEASAKNTLPRPASQKVPLQSWEFDKMVQIAQQTMAAIESGRYTPEHGQILLTMLRGWPGDVRWLQAEVQRMEGLFARSDQSSLQALRKEINDSLVSTLREVQKNLHLVGLEPPGDAEASCHAGPDMDVCAACHGSGQLLEEACPLCEGDPHFAKETIFKPACRHACDVISHRQGLSKVGCCHCTHRRLPTELFAALKVWWHHQSFEPPEVQEAERWRFFCGACSIRWSGMEGSADFLCTDMQQSVLMPVPFGGRVLCVPRSEVHAEAVQPSSFQMKASDAHSRAAPLSNARHDSNDASSDAGSWTFLFDSDDVAGWEIVDERGALT